MTSVCFQASVRGGFISLSDIRAAGTEPQGPGRVLYGSLVWETEAGGSAKSDAAGLGQEGTSSSL